MSSRRRLLRNFTALSMAEAVYRGLAFVTVIVVARLLGPSLLGQIVLAQTLVLYLGALGDAGLTVWTERQIVLAPSRMSTLVMETTAVQVGVALMITGAIIGAGLLAPFPSGTGSLLIAFSPYPLAQALNLQYALQAMEQMQSVAVMRTASQVVTMTGTITLVAITGDPLWVGVMTWAGQLVGDGVAIVILRRRYALSAVRTSMQSAIGLLRHGLPYLGSAALFQYSLAFPLVALGLASNAHELGEYGAAARLAGTAYLLVQVLAAAIYPELIRRYATDRARFADLLERILRLAARVTFPVGVLLAVEAPSVARLVYGPRFAGSADVLRIFALMVPIGWYAGILSPAVLAAGGSYVAGFAAWAITVSLVAVPGIALAGAAGAAVATILGLAAQACTCTVLMRRRASVAPLRWLANEAMYAALPLTTLLLLGAVIALPFGLAVLAWLVAVGSVELALGRPTIFELRWIMRIARASSDPEAAGDRIPPEEPTAVMLEG